MTAADRAHHDALAIVRAIVALGGTGTIAAIAELSGLTRQVATRRLIGNGPANLTLKYNYFTCDRGHGQFGLTSYGRSFLESNVPREVPPAEARAGG